LAVINFWKVRSILATDPKSVLQAATASIAQTGTTDAPTASTTSEQRVPVVVTAPRSPRQQDVQQPTGSDEHSTCTITSLPVTSYGTDFRPIFLETN
jgi:hypothetical protein